jgi:hypothetical protein
MRGLDPVQRLNARENAVGSENPTMTFEKVLDELRHKMALHYLSGK